MKLFVGLGNPGDSYSKNRHNVGFMVIDALNAYMESNFKSRQTISQRSQMKILQALVHDYLPHAVLAKPQIFMNDSGIAVKKLVDRYKVKMDDLYLIHDDLDIPLGEYKIQKGKGPKVHNGVISVEHSLGTNEFWRIRVGIENREKGSKIPGDVYVLQNFALDEEEKIGQAIRKVIEDLAKRWQ